MCSVVCKARAQGSGPIPTARAPDPIPICTSTASTMVSASRECAQSPVSAPPQAIVRTHRLARYIVNRDMNVTQGLFIARVVGAGFHCLTNLTYFIIRALLYKDQVQVQRASYLTPQ